jgi:branched-chain amino acid transport system permease protein
MVVIGGTGSIAGALMAALFLAFAPEILRQVGDLQMVIYGVLLLLCVIFVPSGLAGIPGMVREYMRRRTSEIS